jgi:hypothetical protein
MRDRIPREIALGCLLVASLAFWAIVFVVIWF